MSNFPRFVTRGGTVFCALALALCLPFLSLAASETSAGDTEGAATVPPAPTGSGKIRLASFNGAWLSGRPGVGFVPRSMADIHKVARILRGTHAHLITFQEILDEEALLQLSKEMNRLARGKAKFSFRAEDGTALISPPGERAMNQRLGMLYDSKVLKIRKSRTLDEIAGKGGILRAPLLVRVAVLGHTLDFDFVGLHLKSGMYQKWAREIRTREAKLLVDWMTKSRDSEDPDIVVMGDFNAPRDDETLAALDTLADSGELVAIEEHLQNGPVGTHIPWEIGIDRGFMTRSLWSKAGLRGGASIFRFDDFMPGARDIEDFCIKSRYKIKNPERLCNCEEKPKPKPVEEGQEDWAEVCGVEPRQWAKAANFLRISDHRPLLWDLRLPRKRPRNRSSR